MRRSRRKRQRGIGVAIAALGIAAIAMGYWAFRDLKGDPLERALAGTRDAAANPNSVELATNAARGSKTAGKAAAAATRKVGSAG